MNRPNITESSEHASLQDIKSDVATLKSDLADLIASTAREGGQAANEKLRQIADDTKQSVSEAHSHLATSVSERPITYLALAFGAGAIAAKLLSR